MKRQIEERIGTADEARLLPRYRDRAAMLAKQRAVVRKAVQEAVDEGRVVVFPGMAGGDRERLRGIPVQAKGVGGVQRGTHPEASLIAKEAKQLRKAA